MEEEFFIPVPSLTSEALRLILFAIHTPTEAQYAKYDAYSLPELAEAIRDLNKLNKSVHNGEYMWTDEDIQNAQAISMAMDKKMRDMKDKKDKEDAFYVSIWAKES